MNITRLLRRQATHRFTLVLIVCVLGFALILTGCGGASQSSKNGPTVISNPPANPPAAPQPPISCQTKFRILDPKPDSEFSGDYTKPITVSGEHTLDPTAHIWIFLKDIYGWYYLQNPPAELFPNGKWEATNVRLGKEMRYIVAVSVGSQGHERISLWVKAKRWGAIDEEEIKSLPGGVEECDRMKMRTSGSDS